MSNTLYNSMPYIPVDDNGDMLAECSVILTDVENRYLFISRSIMKSPTDDSSVRFKPLSGVGMRLMLDEFDPDENVFWWHQAYTNNRFCMMPQEFNLMIQEGGNSFDIDGTWSGVRRGNRYGIRLDSGSYRPD
jgi:hypothetical protein